MNAAPAGNAIEWQTKQFVRGDIVQEASQYSGKPSQEVDKAWHDLLNGTTHTILHINILNNCLFFSDENIRIEKEVIESLGREDMSVRVPGEDSYIGTLNMYHELHCIVRSFSTSSLNQTHQRIGRNVFINTCTRISTGKILMMPSAR